jgi:carbon starvation protein
MYATVVAGTVLPFSMPDVNNIPATGIWAILLLIYAFIASCLPITTLLQPRDYMNAWQLFIAMGLLVLSIIISGLFGDLHIVAPAFNPSPEGAPPIMPFLFITIACGAISGFHSLVSSGTSSKQVATEKDAQFVGYGSMLLEATLSTLVIIAVGAGIGLLATDSGLIGTEAWNHHYASWSSAKGLGAKISAFVNGSANMLTFIGIPIAIGKVIMGVFVASFAGTTLDTATRIQRYVVAELFSDINIKFMSNKYTAAAFAVITAFFLAFATGADGKGALTLWPLFGSINQLLASLTLLVVTVYLKEKGGKKYLTTFIPFIFMIIITLLGTALNETVFINKGNWLLAAINGITFILALWIIIEGCKTLVKKKAIQE